MKYRIAIWGLGRDFKTIYPRILEEVKKDTIDITEIIDREKVQDIYGLKVKKPDELVIGNVDYVVIASRKFYWSIYCELLDKGVLPKQIIYGWIFFDRGFEFELYKKNGWLNDNIIANTFSDATYLDLDRLYTRKNLSIKLGRKSYIGKSAIIDGGNDALMSIKIGNYTSISWDCTFDMGLNLDHDYRRVMNYGLTHLEKTCEWDNKQQECCIEIGSDVWIGYDVKIKSGITIGDGAVVASHSVIVKDVAPFTIVGGNPAQIIKRRFSEDIIKKMQEVRWWDWSTKKILEYEKVLDNPMEFLKLTYNKRNHK